jgi:hypothetical protein
MTKANSKDYCNGYGDGWRAGWQSAMDHVHSTVSDALGFVRAATGARAASPLHGAHCTYCGHSDYCDGSCTAAADG